MTARTVSPTLLLGKRPAHLPASPTSLTRVRSGLVAGLLAGLTWALASVSPSQAALPAASTQTGNLLVLLDRGHAHAQSASVVVHDLLGRSGGRLAGRSVPQIGLVTVRPPAGVGLVEFASRLRRVAGVASVQPERRYTPRAAPDDPALSEPSQYSQVVEWALAREGFYDAWNISTGNGALVGVIDTGIDATHPDLVSKIAATVDQQDPGDSTGAANTDQNGHGTHVSSLACAATDNGIGIAGAGYNCRLLVEKTDFSDSSIAAAIVDATDRHVASLNMSFGPANPTSAPAPDAEVRALGYAASHKVVLVAAAADEATSEQGDPSNVLQPSGSGPDITSGIGLDVTAAQYGGARAAFAGYGSEISVAAYGAFEPDTPGAFGIGPPPGLLGAFPANPTALEALPEPCGCRTTFDGSRSYAYLQGTSMAAPQVAALGAMMRVLNPYARLQDVLTAIKRTAQRPANSGWSQDLGWGIINAGAALETIRRVDRQPPGSKLHVPRVARHATFRLRWSGHDAHTPGLIASGIAYYDVYLRSGRGRRRLLAKTARHSRVFRGRRGRRYAFTVVAVDHAGNREGYSDHATTRVAG
jgi:serine protease